MKARCLFFCMISAYCMLVHSQVDYRPFAQNDKEWDIQLGLIPENSYCYTIKGDTLIDGENWKKVYTSMFWFKINPTLTPIL